MGRGVRAISSKGETKPQLNIVDGKLGVTLSLRNYRRLLHDFGIYRVKSFSDLVEEQAKTVEDDKELITIYMSHREWEMMIHHYGLYNIKSITSQVYPPVSD
jgi:hypothetical protein